MHSLPPFVLLPILISLVALLVAVKNYQRKHGLELRGGYQQVSSVYCRDKYICGLQIENLKDRSATIFDIYLKVGRSIYVHLIGFDREPLILKPYETFSKQLPAIECYTSNFSRYDINELLSDPKVPKKLVCSTSEGRYAVPKLGRRWDPVIDSFSNPSIGILYQSPSVYKDVDIGSNVRYIIDITELDGKDTVIPLMPADHDRRVFTDFKLTKEALLSADNLKALLIDRHTAGQLKVRTFDVLDVDEWRKRQFVHYDHALSLMHDSSFIEHHIVGRWIGFVRWVNFKVGKRRFKARRDRTARDNGVRSRSDTH